MFSWHHLRLGSLDERKLWLGGSALAWLDLVILNFQDNEMVRPTLEEVVAASYSIESGICRGDPQETVNGPSECVATWSLLA